MITALLLVPFCGLLSLSVDLSVAYWTKNKLQVASDAGALAAAVVLPANPNNTSAVKNKALHIVAVNVPQDFGTATAVNDVTLGVYDTTSGTFTAQSNKPNAVEVIAHRDTSASNALPTLFARVLGKNYFDIMSRSVATTVAKPCFLTLDPTASPALSVTGQAGMAVPGCSVAVNSNAANAGSATANAQAQGFCFVGGFSGQFSPAPRTCSPAADPMAGLVEPTPGACQTPPVMTGNVTLNPGTYCAAINVGGSTNLTLAPGVYYFNSANFNVSGSANVIGNGVTLFFDKSSVLNINTSGQLNLSAPTSGAYKGMAVFAARNSSLTPAHSIIGGGVYRVDGTIYMPKSTLKMAGIGSTANSASVGSVIAGVIQLSGNATFQTTGNPNTVPNGMMPAPSLVN